MKAAGFSRCALDILATAIKTLRRKNEKTGSRKSRSDTGGSKAPVRNKTPAHLLVSTGARAGWYTPDISAGAEACVAASALNQKIARSDPALLGGLELR
jgi:hypothetical protein